MSGETDSVRNALLSAELDQICFRRPVSNNDQLLTTCQPGQCRCKSPNKQINLFVGDEPTNVQEVPAPVLAWQ